MKYIDTDDFSTFSNELMAANAEHNKSSIRAKVEHVFGIVKSGGISGLAA